jgi:hypothetical protein
MNKQKRNNEVSDLMSLLKVFHVNYATDEIYQKLDGLNPNDSNDVATAVNLVLIPDIANYPISSRARLLAILQRALANSAEDFSELFEELGSVFGDEIIDPRSFMLALFNTLVAAKV